MIDVDKLIEDCITNLSDDNINNGGECLYELAVLWNKAGLTLPSFLNMRIYIIEMAKKKTDAIFIDEKLKLAEKALREKRTGSIIILN